MAADHHRYGESMMAMGKAKYASAPKTVREARARTVRKLAAIESVALTHCFEICGYFDEGAITYQIDVLLDTLRENITAIKECIDYEIERQAEGASE